ncbi:unnamed protein product [Caretta caretta]
MSQDKAHKLHLGQSLGITQEDENRIQCASVAILAAILITLTCCVVKCQEQLKTSDLDEKLANLEEDKGALEKQRDGARAEVTALRSELAGANQTLWETRGRWDSCRSLTHDLQNNITALKDEITQLGGRDTEQGRGQGEIVKLRQQLQEAQQHSDKLQAAIRQLEQQRPHSQKNQSSGSYSCERSRADHAAGEWRIPTGTRCNA